MIGRFGCPACGATLNAFALSGKACPKCGARLRQRLRFRILGGVFAAGALALLVLVPPLTAPASQAMAMLAALLAWWAVMLAWWLKAPWVVEGLPRAFYFVTHPNVAVSREVPVPEWPLSKLGRERMRAGLAQPWVSGIRAVYCSTERKAVDGAKILAEHLYLPYRAIPELGENDRSSTGFLEPEEFERVADEFFARPEASVRGWERAVDAQARVLRAVTGIAETDRSDGAIAIVAHGAVGTLLYCALAGEPISRSRDQPANGGGNFFRFTLEPPAVQSWWSPIDA